MTTKNRPLSVVSRIQAFTKKPATIYLHNSYTAEMLVFIQNKIRILQKDSHPQDDTVNLNGPR
jgi:hypothetical protein